MKHLSSEFYKNVLIKNRSQDLKLDSNNKINNILPNCFEILRNDFGYIKKIRHYDSEGISKINYEPSNKGNLVCVYYNDARGFKIQEKYDYTTGSKILKEKLFFKDNKFLKLEKYKNDKRFEISYFFNNEKYCTEFFKDDKHPYKVEYYNGAGLKI